MDSRRKKQKDAGKPVKVELPHTNQTERSHILHEQEYNTGHDLQAIPNEVCREIWSQPGQPEIQQKPVPYLLLESPPERKCSILVLPVPAFTRPPQTAYRSGAEADPGYAPPQPQSRSGGVVAPPKVARLYPPAGRVCSALCVSWVCCRRERRTQLISRNPTSRRPVQASGSR